jgi:hypothetical protein
MSAARLARWMILAGAAAAVGCEVTPSPTEPHTVVNTTRQAADLANAYCQTHNLYWGPPVMIIREMDGYYVEYGGDQAHTGLVVGYDGAVHP